ncbi:hypothetical protein C3L33_13112, partial [Rhododendron williamsianum]
MEKYIDTIKEYAQKLGAAGSPVNEDDLIFHTLRVLPKVFNGFKTAVRTRGGTITFAELINMLNGEDLQLLQESDTDISYVLVATHGNKSVQDISTGHTLTSTTALPHMQFQMPTIPSQFGVPMQSQQASHVIPSMSPIKLPQISQFSNMSPGLQPANQFQYFPSSHYSPQSFRPFSRGKGRGPRMPCDICGRLNHSTNLCYYKGQSQFPFDQWRSSTPPSWMYPGYPTGMPMFRPGIPVSMSSVPRQSLPNPSMVSPSTSQPSFAGFTEAYTFPYMSPTTATTANYTGVPGFTEAYNAPYLMPGTSSSSFGYPGSSP